MLCPKCGNEEASGKFCNECGEALTLTCPNCGNENASGKFCNECGHDLSEPVVEPEPFDPLSLDPILPDKQRTLQGEKNWRLEWKTGNVDLYNGKKLISSTDLRLVTKILYHPSPTTRQVGYLALCTAELPGICFNAPGAISPIYIKYLGWSPADASVIIPITSGVMLDFFANKLDEALSINPEYIGLLGIQEINSLMQQTQPAITQDPNEVRCPKCGSASLAANKKGFGVGKAIVGGLLTGGVGLLAGSIGAKKVRITCLKCGHQWMA